MSVSLWVSSVVWNKLTSVGALFLDVSKLVLYKLDYEEMLPSYGPNRSKVVRKNTDSLLCRVMAANLYEDMSALRHFFDFWDFPKDHFLDDKTNKKVPLRMTDLLNGKVLKEVVCIRSKINSIECLGWTKQGAKSARKLFKKIIHHSLFKNYLLSKIVLHHQKLQNWSVGHQIVVNVVNKVEFSCFDDRRSFLDATVSCLAYGQYFLANPKRIARGLQKNKEQFQRKGCQFKKNVRSVFVVQLILALFLIPVRVSLMKMMVGVILIATLFFIYGKQSKQGVSNQL